MKNYKSICLSLLFMTHVVSVEAESNTAVRPNILFIITDQQFAGMLSCTGNSYVNTPAIDSLAATGAPQ